MNSARRLGIVATLALLPAAACGGERLAMEQNARVAQELGLPADYRAQYTHYADVYCLDLNRMRSLWANDAALRAAAAGERLPEGSVLVGEMYLLEFTPEGEPRRGPLHHISVSRRARLSDTLRSLADWTYSGKNADLSSLRPGDCAACHENAEDTDYVYTIDDMAHVGRGGAERPEPVRHPSTVRSAECR